MPVLQKPAHKHLPRGDASMRETEFAATYKFGNSTVHIVSPPPMSEEDKEKILDQFHDAGWAIIFELLERGEKV